MSNTGGLGFGWMHCHTPLILDLLREQECLWNRRHVHYRNKVAREQSLNVLIEKLQLPDLNRYDMTLKIKSIRTRYCAELVKMLKSPKDENGEHAYIPKLFWFSQADQFLRAVCVPRTIQEKKQEAANRRSVIFSAPKADYTVPHIPEDPAGPCDEPVVNHEEIIIISEEEPAVIKNKDCGGHLSRTYHFDYDDEFDLFAQSLAVQLKKMPLHRALVCQERLQKTMTEERMVQLCQINNK